MPFKVVIRDDLSLAQLAEMSREGQSVMKSPHVGNFYPNNLAIASLGIPINLYDRTIGEIDKNAHPHLVIVNGQSEEVANPKLLTAHSRIQRQPQFFPDYFPIGQSVTRGHMQALQKALPRAQFVTYTDYLRQNTDLVMDILKTATALYPTHWERVVQQDGIVFNKSAPEWQDVFTWIDIKTQKIYGLTDQNQGLIIPLTFTILLLGMVEVFTKKMPEVYHLSGPDMFRYVKRMEPVLTQIYDLARKHLAGLPEELIFSVVPVADMRFTATTSRQKSLDELVEAYLDFRRQEIQCAQMAQIPDNDGYIGYTSTQFREKVLKTKEGAVKRLRDAFGDCPNVLYDIKEAVFTSQYDLLCGEQLYVNPWGTETPIKDVSKAIQLLTKIRNTLYKAQRPIFVEDTISGGIK